jgi:hypothetical protein
MAGIQFFGETETGYTSAKKRSVQRAPFTDLRSSDEDVGKNPLHVFLFDGVAPHAPSTPVPEHDISDMRRSVEVAGLAQCRRKETAQGWGRAHAGCSQTYLWARRTPLVQDRHHEWG